MREVDFPLSQWYHFQMKKIIACLLVVFALPGLFAQQQYTVAVAPFDLANGFSRDDADVIEVLFFTELGRTGGVKVVDRNTFERTLAQRRFQTSDWSDSNKVAELGKALNANAIIRGQLMVFAGRLIVTAHIVDVNSRAVLSAPPMQLNGLNELFGKMPGFAADVVKGLPGTGTQPQATYQIGGRGPGGGMIFFAEGGQYMEVSGELGKANWDEAATAARNFRGGGFNDWRLPTRTELELMYQNLKRRNLGGFNNERYWSSTENNPYNAWNQDFSDGRRSFNYKTDSYRFRVIRVF